MKNLLIVESPNKCKTIASYLGEDWKVIASLGHIRRLPEDKMTIEPPHFTPQYQVIPERKSTIAKLCAEAKLAETIWLATDPDREGEAIAWHIHEVLRPVIKNKRVNRITFGEITQAAVLKAIDSPRGIDHKLVEAQQAREAIDRLIGYSVSPLLTRAMRSAQSAGRVQSPALRLIVDRELEIRSFIPTKHYGVQMTFNNDGIDWVADWLIDGKESIEGSVN